MATLTFFKSATDDGGAKGAQLTDGEVDNLLPAVTSQDRLHGVTIHRKIWIESDTDISVLTSLSNEGQYNSYWFESAGVNDTVADITGNETKYGPMNIVSNTQDQAIVTNDTGGETIMRVNDYAFIGADVVKINTITDNGDGTSTVGFSPTIPAGDHSGTTLCTLINKSFTASTAVPYWVKIVIPELAPSNSNYNTVQFLTVY